MGRLLPLILLATAACDRSTPPMEPVPTAGSTPTPTVVLSTVSAAPRSTAQPSITLPRPPEDAIRSRVLRVSDGDTVVLSNIGHGERDASTGGRKARLIGIDTPEVFGEAECFGRQASAFVTRELDGRDVLVDFDVDKIDRYGRALVYIWKQDGTFFNGRLAAEGYALQATFVPNVRYVELFTRLVRSAREEDRGLWNACT